MAKLPGIVQQSVAEYQKGYIPQPNYAARGRAIQGLLSASAQAIETVKTINEIKEVDTASGAAANELSELRARLENQHTIPASDVPPDILTPLHTTVTEGLNGRREISKPFVYTYEVANDIWAKRSSEILEHHAQSIPNAAARAKFIGEMTERYIAPGTASITTKSILGAQAFSQAQAESTMQEIAASVANPADREQAMREVIARRVIMGADPIWAETQMQAIGPMIDQFDAQNDIINAQNIDDLDQVEENMWSGGTRMSPAQVRTMGEQVNKKRTEMRRAETERQVENGELMFVSMHDPDIAFGLDDVNAALNNGDINWAQAWTFRNALQSGSTTRATDPFALSRYRGAITAMQYTGNQARVTERADRLRVAISRASMGLNPDGSPNPLGPTISGEDAFRLGKDIDTAESAALENNEYDNAFRQLTAWTRVNVDLTGQIVQALGGNQDTVEAALAFKQALDNYMDQYGADAKPVDFINDNKDAYNPINFSYGINAEFINQVPQAQNFMEIETGNRFSFSTNSQQEFTLWLANNEAQLGGDYDRVWTLFRQYYRGEGLAPANGALQLEQTDPLYQQFEAYMISDQP